MRIPLSLPDDTTQSIGRELRRSGDIVFAGAFGDDDENGTMGMFFARLFTIMADDGIGLLIDPRSIRGLGAGVMDRRIFDAENRVVGCVVDEMIEHETLFCAAMIRVDGMAHVMSILRHQMLWPIFSAVDARCSTCGMSYNHRTAFRWCKHISSGRKHPIVNVLVRHLVLSDQMIEQSLPDMFRLRDCFAEIGLSPLGDMMSVPERDGDFAEIGMEDDAIAISTPNQHDDIIGVQIGPSVGDVIRIGDDGGDEPRITCLISDAIGRTEISGTRLAAGGIVSLPMSVVYGEEGWQLISSGAIIPVGGVGNLGEMFPASLVPDRPQDAESTGG